MFPIYLYLVALIISPQLWIPPFIGWPTDFIIYPMLLLSIVVSGRLPNLLKFGAHELLFIGFFFAVMVGAFLNGMSAATEEQLIIYFKFFVLYKLTTALIADVSRAQKFFKFFHILVLILAVECIQQKLSLDGSGWANQGRAWIDPDVLKAGGVGRSRWIGIFDGPGVFCVLFTISLPLLFPLLDKRHSTMRRLGGAALILLILGATYCTGSRGGLLASVAVTGLYIMLKAKVSVRSIVISIILAVGVYAAAPSYLTKMNDQSNSTQYRVEMWAAGLDMVKER
ncbi:MAG TPA: O-antigen ligase family protein, partial [Steroidobacteraceae bacterium]|nr:O-antigen ligase family protein [Steroidobacteraceae bacterium]